MAVATMTPAELHARHRHWEHTALITELILALGAVVLGILGLVGLFPTPLAAIAVIALGVMLLSEGASIVFRAYELLAEAGTGETLAASEAGRAITAEFLAGVAGVVLGILGLIGIKTITLVLVALLAIGAAALLRSSALGGFLQEVLRR